MNIADKNYLSVGEITTQYEIAPRTIYNYWKKWNWKGFNFGSKLYFSEESVKQWAANRITAIS